MTTSREPATVRRFRERRDDARRRGTVAVEVMILGPVIAFLMLSMDSGYYEPGLTWAMLSILSIYLLYRFAGDLSRTP